MGEANIKQLPDYLVDMLESPFLYVGANALKDVIQLIHQKKGNWQKYQQRLYEDVFNSTCAETVHNGGKINWLRWSGLTNISSNQAARLTYHIDPYTWPNPDVYKQGSIPNELKSKINFLEQQLACKASLWTLAAIVEELGIDEAPYGMVEAVRKQRIDEAAKHSIEIQRLEPLTDEQKQDYYSLAAWSWVDAIYILQGYKPAYQLSTEQVRSHFPDWVKYFTDSLLLETIGKKTTQAGQTNYIDTPANWQAFWQNINKRPEPEPEGVEITPKVDATAKPWLIPETQDPEPVQDWYIPARYFARELVKEDSTLLLKRELLAKKISMSLANVGIYKRGGKLPFKPGTVKKALSNIVL